MQPFQVPSGPFTPLNSEITFPYDIQFVDCPPSDAVRFQVEQYLVKLNRLSNRITDCRVSVRIPHKHGGNRFFHVHASLDMPGRRIAVSREPEIREERTDVHTAISSTFHKLTRQLEDHLKSRL